MPRQYNIRPPLERFWKFVHKSPEPDGCWEWIGSKDGKGYGHFWLRDRHVKAHRFAYETFVGPIPDGNDLCHHCDNPKCIRPDHLFTGTRSDNILDAVAKGRWKGGGRPCHNTRPNDAPEKATVKLSPEERLLARREYYRQYAREHDHRPRKGCRPHGPQVYSAKLTWVQATEIRLRYAAKQVTQNQLAADYGVSRATIRHVLSGRSYDPRHAPTHGALLAMP